MAKERLFRTCAFGGYNKEDVMEYIHTLEAELEKMRTAAARRGQTAPDVIVFDGTESGQGAASPGAGLRAGASVPQEQAGQGAAGGPAGGAAEGGAAEPDDCGAAVQKAAEEARRANEEARRADEELKLMERKLAETERAMKEKLAEAERAGRRLEQLALENERLEKELEVQRQQKGKYEEDYEAVKTVLLNAKIDAEIVVVKARERASAMIAEAEAQIEDQRKNFLSVLTKYMGIGSDGLAASRFRIEDQMRSVEKAQRELGNIRSYMEDILGTLPREESERENHFTVDENGRQRADTNNSWENTTEV